MLVLSVYFVNFIFFFINIHYIITKCHEFYSLYIYIILFNKITSIGMLLLFLIFKNIFMCFDLYLFYYFFYSFLDFHPLIFNTFVEFNNRYFTRFGGKKGTSEKEKRKKKEKDTQIAFKPQRKWLQSYARNAA